MKKDSSEQRKGHRKSASPNGMSQVVAAFFLIGLGWNAWAQDGQSARRPSRPRQATDRSVSLREIIPNVVDDQKRIWTFPAHLGHDHHWIPALAVLATTAALVAADPWTAKPFTTTTAFHGFNSVFSGTATSAGIAIVPVSFMLLGLLTEEFLRREHSPAGRRGGGGQRDRSHRAQDRHSQVTTGVCSPPAATLAIPGLKAPGGVGLGHGGFPSGHTIAAFSVATVIARRYGKHASLGSVRGLRIGGDGRVLASHNAGTFSVGCIPGRGTGIFGQPLRRIAVMDGVGDPAGRIAG